MLVGADNRAVDEVDPPIELAARIGLPLEGREDPVPDPRFLPAVEPAGDGPPGPVAFGQIAPGSAGLEDPEDAVDDPPVVMVGTPHPRFLWWEKLLQALPLRFG
jgi:hypothetical protein